MIIRQTAKNVPSTPKKIQLVAEAIKRLKPAEALELLNAYNNKASLSVAKTLKAAIANAVNNHSQKVEDLAIHQILIGKGITFKRFLAGARGRAKPYVKTRSHVTVELIVKQPKAPKAAKVEAPKVEAAATPEVKKTVAKKVTKKASNK